MADTIYAKAHDIAHALHEIGFTNEDFDLVASNGGIRFVAYCDCTDKLKALQEYIYPRTDLAFPIEVGVTIEG